MVPIGEKKCIFCNNEVVDKTKEHVIPQWLIRKTGKLNRKINLGLNREYLYNADYEFDERKIQRTISFNSFTFPACNSCNNYYSSLETSMQSTLSKLEKEKPLNYSEINTLLDWFDKVRVGLWYGTYYLNKVNINPKFGIEQRMGSQDRVLMIIRNDSLQNGINFTGSSNPSFDKNPISFGMRINDLWFLNISTVNFISQDLGYEYLKLVKLGGGITADEAQVIDGSGLISLEEINKKLPSGFSKGLVIMQPITTKNEDGELKSQKHEIHTFNKLGSILKVNKNETLDYSIPSMYMNPIFSHSRAVEIQEKDLRNHLKAGIVDKEFKDDIEFTLYASEEFTKLIYRLSNEKMIK